MRLDFISKAYGVPMRQLPTVLDEYRADPAVHYRKHHEAEIIGSLRAQRPVVTIGNDTCVVFGWDGGNPPLLGQLACTCELNVSRLDGFPWVAIVLGPPGEPMDRRQVDVEALDFAIHLGRDEVDLRELPGKSTGRRSWELWAEQLADAELCGPHFYHANVVGHLHENRACAAAYLRAMSERHSPPVTRALSEAAAKYDAVLSLLRQMNTSKDALSNVAGREKLVAQIRQIVSLEAKALDRMEEAIGAIR